MTRGWRCAIVGYGVLALLGIAAVTWSVMTSLAQLDLLGNAVQVRLAECHQESAGRAGSHTVCSGPQMGNEKRTVEVQYEGRPREVVRVSRTPWGTYEAVETGPVAWGIGVLMPVIPLMATVGVGALTARECATSRKFP